MPLNAGTVAKRIRERTDLLVLAAILVAIQFLPGKAMPPGIYGLGLFGGATLGLHAIGIVLVYRSNRIINFAQVQIGAVAATLFTLTVRFGWPIRMVQNVCPPCIQQSTQTVYNVNYYVAIVLSLGLAFVLGWAVYTFVIKRFANAPRLVLTVATIFLAQFLAWVQGLLPGLLTTELQRESQGFNLGPSPIPFDFEVQWSPARFHAPEVLTMAAFVATLVGLYLYFRRSTTGVAIRASSENAARVATLGINSNKVTVRVWVFAAMISGVAGILQAMLVGVPGTNSLSVSLLVRILTIALIARFASVPIAAFGALVIGIFDQAVLWSFGADLIVNGLLLVAIGAVLVLQRDRASRAELEQASAWHAAREIRPIPGELRRLPAVRSWLRVLGGLGALILLGFPWAMSPSQTNLAAAGFIFGIVIVSLLVLTGWAGQISLGQFALAALGGYVAAIIHAPFPLVVLTGACTGGVAAVIIGFPALKLRGLHLAVTTMALALTVQAFLLNPRYLGKHLPSSIDRPTFFGMSLEDQRVYYYLCLVVLALVVVAVVGLRRSRTARALIAARDNDQAAQSFGINLVRLRLSAFAISGFFAALAGGLFAFHQHAVSATAFAPEVSVTMFVMAVIGGLGSVAGPLIGTAFYTILKIFSVSPLIEFFATGAGGLLILLFIPGGLSQLVYGIRDSILRRVASRHRIVVPSLVADTAASAEGARAPILPKRGAAGGEAFVPVRYRLEDQWLLGATKIDDGSDGGQRPLASSRPAQEPARG